MKNDLIKTATWLQHEVASNGIKFTSDGYPILTNEMLIKERPEEILPFEHRKQCHAKEKTILCSFANDELLYRRLKHLDSDILLYEGYMGVAGFDLSPRLGWDINQQKFNLLLNHLVDAYRAIHGVKILPNFRTGDMCTLSVLNSYPPKSWYAVGTLGCSKGYVPENSALLRAKLVYNCPDRLLIYGILRNEYKEILDEYGVPYHVYRDFKNCSFQNQNTRRNMI